MTTLASIPSPADNVWDIHLGSFHLPLHIYGLMIALGVLAAIWLSRKRWAAWGHDPDLVIDLAYWGVPGGLIGARLYHVITDYNRLYVDNFWGIFKIWDGGLGIPGGILGGVLAGYICARRHKAPVPDLLDMVAPALPLAQAIGRFGNYFNQELYGRPTTLPWGLQIDPAHRPPDLIGVTTFHPTFAYEALWNLGLMGVLLGIDRYRGTGRDLPRVAVWCAYGLFALGGGLDVLLVAQRQTELGTAAQIGLFIVGAVAVAALFGWASGLNQRGLRRRADLFVTYVAGYFLGRLWVESLRIDTANTIVGLRLNEWVAIIVVLGALAALKWRGRSDELRPIDVGSGSIAPPDTDDVGAAAGSPDAEGDSAPSDAGDDAPGPNEVDQARATNDLVSSSGADEVAEADVAQPES
ncbi:MAG TPA: prolipoprotein diacylglyceryl transferase [Acidimicrobiales bacterium]|nr:prolipoprotein diacylglyceryl transferase [Acidimicrobiales bacterium]